MSPTDLETKEIWGRSEDAAGLSVPREVTANDDPRSMVKTRLTARHLRSFELTFMRFPLEKNVLAVFIPYARTSP